ncbi:MAG: exodeoxyribonuclease VII small subunit [Oscillospiraceae bacterium]
MSFEQALNRLDDIVAQLADGNTTLEQSLALYTEGTKLIAQCSGQLEKAKTTLETLTLPKGE